MGLVRQFAPRRSPRFIAVLTLASVAMSALYCVGVTCVGYARGTVRLVPESVSFIPEFNNLDPHDRVWHRRGGTWWLPRAYDAIERRTFRGLTWGFGPMRGSYQGPYPSAQQALDALMAQAEFLSAERARRDILLPGRDLPWELGDEALSDSLDPARPVDDQVALALFGSHCLVLGFWEPAAYRVYLADTQKHGWFATYRYDERLVPYGDGTP